MKMRTFYYIVTQFENNEIFSCGAEFSEFMEMIHKKPEHMLILDGQFGDGEYNSHTGMEYADPEHMDLLINDDVYSYGNFCCVDFKNMEDLDAITSLELAELLYIAHTFKPLDSPWLKRLKNDYLYLAHDDDYWTRIYMKDLSDYKNVIHGKILKALKGRKKTISPVPDEILDYIFENTKDGIMIDFENTYFAENATGVRIYKIGKNYNYDSIYEVFKRKQYFTNTEIILEYNNRTKKWKTYGEWK